MTSALPPSPPHSPLSKKAKAAVAVALSWGAGLTDVVGYLTLHHAFTSHMTGNTVATVMYAADGNWREVLHRGTPIPAFFAGLLVGELVLEGAKRRRRRHVAARGLGLEAICLALFLALGLWRFGPADRSPDPAAPLFVVLVALVAAAMGVQSASLRKVGALTIFTTFITGTLTVLADDLAKYLLWLNDRTRGRMRARLGKALRLSVRQQPFQSAALLAGLYLSYAVGALSGVEGFHRWGVAAAAAPLALVLTAVGIDLVRPISPAT